MEHICKRLDARRAVCVRSLTRRDVLTTAAAVVGASSALAGLPQVVWGQAEKVVKQGRIKQSMCGGCLRKARREPGDLLSRSGQGDCGNRL